LPLFGLSPRQSRWTRRWMALMLVGLAVFVVGVEPDVKVPQNKALETAQVMASRRLAEKEEDPEFKAYYRWHHDAYNAGLNPVIIAEESLRSYVGAYGPRMITLEGGSLYYQREGQAKIRMTPIADSYFMLDGIDNFRLRFLKEGDRIIAVEGCNPAGAIDKQLKNK